jgi:hypothetical protein
MAFEQKHDMTIWQFRFCILVRFVICHFLHQFVFASLQFTQYARFNTIILPTCNKNESFMFIVLLLHKRPGSD